MGSLSCGLPCIFITQFMSFTFWATSIFWFQSLWAQQVDLSTDFKPWSIHQRDLKHLTATLGLLHREDLLATQSSSKELCSKAAFGFSTTLPKHGYLLYFD